MFDLWEEIRSAGPYAKPLLHSKTFQGWLLTALFMALYMVGLSPDTLSEWMAAAGTALGQATALVGILRRQDIKVF